MAGLLLEVGPCMVNADGRTTRNNPWAWNRLANMLFIDQPVQTGFSYDWLVNATIDALSENVTVFGKDENNPYRGIPQQNSTFYVGTLSSQRPKNTANTTTNAARAFWNFAQTWFTAFPEHRPSNDRVSIWTESYGGRYGPAFAAYFSDMNTRIRDGLIDRNTYVPIHLDTLGIINGCIDPLSHLTSFPTFAFNNTYGIQAINSSAYHAAMTAADSPGGCRDQIAACHTIIALHDPAHTGINETVNSFCASVATNCTEKVEGPYTSVSGRGYGYYDVAAPSLDPFPSRDWLAFLNQPSTQYALGVPLNFSFVGGGPVSEAFDSTGDYAIDRPGKDGYQAAIGRLLDDGVAVAMVYGDRDYACNWIGGEQTSLTIPRHRPVGAMDSFKGAGYADIVINGTEKASEKGHPRADFRSNSIDHDSEKFVGGLVRQIDSFSFSRVFQAGHMVPTYQPETALRIFERTLAHVDIATGSTPIPLAGNYTEDYSSPMTEGTNSLEKGASPDTKTGTGTSPSYHYRTHGYDTAWAVRQFPPSPESLPPHQCHVLDLEGSCTKEEVARVANGSAVIVDWKVSE